jgi:predicted  nucleic acid-binding Zn-ribbon protein
MADKDKGFRFKSLFIRDAETGEPKKPVQTREPAIKNDQEDYIAPVNAQDMPLVDDFVQRLQNLINQNNQAGFDFLEFTESLFEEKQNPTPDVYKTVFRIAQKIDKSLTPARLLESSMYYKDLVQRTAETEINKGVAKKQSLQGDKDTERTNLDNSLKSTRTKIQQLSKQIQELQNQDLNLSNQLAAIDQKYENQFTDIDRKINAIRDAKEKVLVSIVDIEAGIKSNIS